MQAAIVRVDNLLDSVFWNMTEQIQHERAEVVSPWSSTDLDRMLVVTLVLALLAVLASIVNVASWRAGGVTILWPSNGFLIGVLLCTARGRWLPYFCIAVCVDICVNMSLGMEAPVSAYFSACNLLEVYVAVKLLYPIVSPEPDLTRRRQLVFFLLYGVLIAPAIAAAAASFFISHKFALPDLHAFQYWFSADALGIAIVTPLCLSFVHRKRFSGTSWPLAVGLFLLLGSATVIVFTTDRYPILYLVLPFLVFLGMRLRLAGSAIGLFLVCALGGILTSRGHGPFMLTPGGSISTRILGLQLFVAVCMLLLYVVEVMLSESNRLQVSLEASENRFRLLAEASRDVIVLTDLNGDARYVSPAIHDLLGWNPDEIVGQSYKLIVHPDDVPSLAKLLHQCRSGEPYNTLSYRCRRTDGSYLWMEGNFRLCSDAATGQPLGFVNVVRDIGSRKAAEEELHRAVDRAQALAGTDGLTAVANRRVFDQTIAKEWQRAVRDRTSLSLVVFDVDHFKLYNDAYGHVQGDTCLRLIAECTRSIVRRPGDLVARFGGDEFVLILPNTDRAGAEVIAEEIRAAISCLGLPHNENPHGRVTVSIGCASQVPKRDALPEVLLTAADQALYEAKAAGRDRSRSARLTSE